MIQLPPDYDFNNPPRNPAEDFDVWPMLTIGNSTGRAIYVNDFGNIDIDWRFLNAVTAWYDKHPEDRPVTQPQPEPEIFDIKASLLSLHAKVDLLLTK